MPNHAAVIPLYYRAKFPAASAKHFLHRYSSYPYFYSNALSDLTNRTRFQFFKELTKHIFKAPDCARIFKSFPCPSFVSYWLLVVLAKNWVTSGPPLFSTAVRLSVDGIYWSPFQVISQAVSSVSMATKLKITLIIRNHHTLSRDRSFDITNKPPQPDRSSTRFPGHARDSALISDIPIDL